MWILTLAYSRFSLYIPVWLWLNMFPSPPLNWNGGLTMIVDRWCGCIYLCGYYWCMFITFLSCPSSSEETATHCMFYPHSTSALEPVLAAPTRQNWFTGKAIALQVKGPWFNSQYLLSRHERNLCLTWGTAASQCSDKGNCWFCQPGALQMYWIIISSSQHGCWSGPKQWYPTVVMAKALLDLKLFLYVQLF